MRRWVCHRWTLEPGASYLCFCTCEMWIAIQFSTKLAADQMKEYVQRTHKDLAYGTASWNVIWYCYYWCMCTHCYYYYTQGSLKTEMIRKDSGGSCDLERNRGREGQHSSHQGWRVYPMCKHFNMYAPWHLKQVMRFTVSQTIPTRALQCQETQWTTPLHQQR